MFAGQRSNFVLLTGSEGNGFGSRGRCRKCGTIAP